MTVLKHYERVHQNVSKVHSSTSFHHIRMFANHQPSHLKEEVQKTIMVYVLSVQETLHGLTATWSVDIHEKRRTPAMHCKDRHLYRFPCGEFGDLSPRCRWSFLLLRFDRKQGRHAGVESLCRSDETIVCAHQQSHPIQKIFQMNITRNLSANFCLSYHSSHPERNQSKENSFHFLL